MKCYQSLSGLLLPSFVAKVQSVHEQNVTEVT